MFTIMISKIKQGLRNAIISRLAHRDLPKFGLHSYAQEGEDILLSRILEAVKITAGTFVEVGSNSPWRYSNSAFFYLKGWRGIAIDPNPDFAIPFSIERPGDVYLNLGISNETGQLKYFRFPESLYNTFSAEKAKQLVESGIMPEPEIVNVNVESLKNALERIWPDGRSIDLLSIDAEGYDEKIVLGHDFEKFPARFLIMEFETLEISTALNEPITHLLQERGFVFVSKLWKSGLFINRTTAEQLGISCGKRPG